MDALTILALIPFYLLGAFPTGTLIAKRSGVDLTAVGSGNVGATNVARVLGRKAGIATLLVDASKGAIATFIASALSGSPAFTGSAALACVAGHCFSIPGKFRGGKGVSTALGTIAYLSPITASSILVIFAGMFVAFRIVSLASVTAALMAPIIFYFLDPESTQLAQVALIAILLAIRHQKNIRRIINGEEPRFDAKSNVELQH